MRGHQLLNITVNVLKFRTLFFFCSQIKCWFSVVDGSHKMLVWIANREDIDQTASGSALFVLTFLPGNLCSKISKINSPFLFMNLFKGLFVLYINLAVLQQGVDFVEQIFVVSGFSYLYRVGARSLLNLGKNHFTHQIGKIWFSLKQLDFF